MPERIWKVRVSNGLSLAVRVPSTVPFGALEKRVKA